MPIIITLVITLFFGYFLYRAIFDDLDDLLTSIKFWLSPDLLDWIMGHSNSDFWAEFKIMVWLGMTFLIGYGSYMKLTH